VTSQGLGKIFISHASIDKPFVRRLTRRLKKANYSIWLDEHELVAGDPLGAKIAEALRRARVVLVVVSESSVKSKWLRYELNVATERMVKGECRVIPAVIGDVDLPPEVLGLLYADFRKAFKHGFKSIEIALKYEAGIAEAQARFYLVADNLVSKVFTGRSYVSIDGEYSARGYETVHVGVPSDEDAEATSIVYENASAYTKPSKPLNDTWWGEFRSSMEELPERLYLMLTERPIAFDVVRPDPAFTNVSYRGFYCGDMGPYAYAVFVELGELDRSEWGPCVERAKNLLSEFARRISRSD